MHGERIKIANENLWAKVETEIGNHATSNKDDLKKALREEWERVGPEYKKKKNTKWYNPLQIV